VGAKFARAEVRSAYAAVSRIAFKFGKIVDYYNANILNFIKFNARRRILKFTAFFAL